MKTANLPSAISGHYNARRNKLHRTGKAKAPGKISAFIIRVKRAFELLALLMVMMLGFIQKGVAQTEGPKDARTGANITGIGSVAWSDPGNITTTGSPYATAVIYDNSQSNYLLATNYDFSSMPDNATILGITVTINRSGSSTSNNGVVDNQVSLRKGTAIQTTNFANTSTEWPTSLTVASYGGSDELWGTTWTVSEIKSSNFGVALSARVNRDYSNNYSRTASVDYIQITITYSLPIPGEYPTAGTYDFTVPPGVNEITVKAWGGGGAGGGVTDQTRAGGGGEGGSFVMGTISVTPGATYTVVVGGGGTGVTGNGTAGGASSFGGSGLFNAIGGAGGAAGNSFGAGGNTTNTGNAVSGTSTSNYYGGNGGTATSTSSATSGGGGGSAGAGGNGGNGGAPTAGIAGAGGSPSYPGAAGAVGRGSQNDGDGNTGNTPGGGGSGARNANDNTDYTGGNGAAGKVVITWVACTPPSISGHPSTAEQNLCLNGSATTLSVTASNTTGYQWYSNTTPSNSGGTPITGANSSSFIPLTDTDGTRYYYCIASGACAPVATSNISGAVIVKPQLTFTTSHNDLTCFGAGTGSITVSASGGSGSGYEYRIHIGTTYIGWQTSNVFGSLSAGDYAIEVKDNLGCLSQ